MRSAPEMSYPHKDARTPHGACAAPPPQPPPRLFVFQRSVVATGVTFCERRCHFAGTGGEDCEGIARPGTFDWIERDAGNRVGYGAADPRDDGLVRIGQQDA